MASPNTIAFPVARSARSSALSDNASSLSLTHHQTAAEICELFYGASAPAWQAVDRFYDPNATYENPVITATNKDTIADVHTLAQYLSQLDVPKPTAILCALFRLSADHRWRDAWFRGVSMWNEVNDISECESFGESLPDRRRPPPRAGRCPRRSHSYSSIPSRQTDTNGRWLSTHYTSSFSLVCIHTHTRRPKAQVQLRPRDR